MVTGALILFLAFPDVVFAALFTSVPWIKMLVGLVHLSDSEDTLVSLVSVWGRNWCYLCGTVERVEKDEIVEIANIHAVFIQVAENMLG